MRSTTGHTFGGHAVAPWASPADGAYTTTAGCFLFLVENPHNDAPTCFECPVTPEVLGREAFAWSTYCHPKNGPTFGGLWTVSFQGGHDLCIHEGSDTGESFTEFQRRYTDTLGRGHATFTGHLNFTPEDYEVWAVT